MRKMLLAAVAALSLLGAPVVTAEPAAADTPGCVTRHEFQKIRDGWKKTRVHRVFDTSGWAATDGYRRYKPCGDETGGLAYYYMGYARFDGAVRYTGDGGYWNPT